MTEGSPDRLLPPAEQAPARQKAGRCHHQLACAHFRSDTAERRAHSPALAAVKLAQPFAYRRAGLVMKCRFTVHVQHIINFDVFAAPWQSNFFLVTLTCSQSSNIAAGGAAPQGLLLSPGHLQRPAHALRCQNRIRRSACAGASPLRRMCARVPHQSTSCRLRFLLLQLCLVVRCSHLVISAHGIGCRFSACSCSYADPHFACL